MKKDRCMIDGCDEPVDCKGLCHACYQWDYYHMTRRHGMAYMMKRRARNERMASRISARIHGGRKRQAS